MAQQAAEKAFKAVLIFLQIDYPYSHDLAEMCNRIPPGWQIKAGRAELDRLSRWAVEGRYPTDAQEPAIEDARAACAQARSVLDSVTADLHAHGFPI